MKNDNLTYDWLDFLALQKSEKKPIKEDKIRDFVSGRNIQLAQDAGVIDSEFESANNDFIKIDPSWVSSNIVNVDLINGGKVQFHKKYADRLKQAFELSCRATGWSPENQTQGYCPRPNGGFVPRRSRAPSETAKPVEQRQIGGHAWGTSIDLGTAQENPMGGGGRIRQYPEFINTMKENGFIWGGDFSNKDDMHFEVDIKANPSILDFNYKNLLSQAYDYIKDIGSSAWEGAKSVFAESIDEQLFHINDKSKKQIYKNNKKYFDSLLIFLKKKLKITKPVKITFEEDKNNSKEVLGRTGGYINEQYKIHIFVTDRHIKDVMRSLAHEMVHHRQNIRGEFKEKEPTIHGYAQKNPHLRKMEKEAYLKGNMIFRDWEDNYKYRGEK